jgi:glutamate synthase domain-containing protein 2
MLRLPRSCPRAATAAAVACTRPAVRVGGGGGGLAARSPPVQRRALAASGGKTDLDPEHQEARAVRGAGFPDFIEKWDRKKFKQVGAGFGLISASSLGLLALSSGESVSAVGVIWTASFSLLTGGYWYVGLRDIRQTQHAIRRNFPVLGNMRYLLEVLRPEIRQYFVEGDDEAKPFPRERRSIVYARAKNMTDTVAFGTRRNVYEKGYEWAVHGLFPSAISADQCRATIGASNPACTQPYSASLLNISAMSYGALSDNAILALNTAAKSGNFYHNTGEGGISRFHRDPGGDIVWNVGTGYFGCGRGTLERRFDPDMFAENAALPQVKMIELKLSQGAKPGHGGLLPAAKITPTIAEARGLGEPPYHDCNSPASHSAFSDADGLIAFLQQLQKLSGGKPVGFKMCVGRPIVVLDMVRAMVDADFVPDFITVDGGEGGTGAAPHEFSNSIGMPLEEGLYIVDNLLRGAGLRDRTKIIAAGKVISGFSIVKMLALGADVCNSARGMMFALGCIQALKCNTNTCPTGITTQNKELMKGLVVPDKAERVAMFQQKTVHMAADIIGAMGLEAPEDVDGRYVMRRTSKGVQTFREIFPKLPNGALLNSDGGINSVDLDADHDGRISVQEFRNFSKRRSGLSLHPSPDSEEE